MAQDPDRPIEPAMPDREICLGLGKESLFPPPLFFGRIHHHHNHIHYNQFSSLSLFLSSSLPLSSLPYSSSSLCIRIAIRLLHPFRHTLSSSLVAISTRFRLPIPPVTIGRCSPSLEAAFHPTLTRRSHLLTRLNHCFQAVMRPVVAQTLSALPAFTFLYTKSRQ